MRRFYIIGPAQVVALIFNARGRQAVSNVAGDGAWAKIALARLPIAVILAALAFFAP